MDKIKILKEAYEYAYPLVAFFYYKEYYTDTIEATPFKAPVNQFFHAEKLSTPAERLPAPNMDTVYSQGYFDLKKEPIVIKKPRTDLGCSICVNDTYGNCIAIIGTGSELAAKYGCGYGDEEEYIFALVGPEYTGEIPNTIAKISVPTNMAHLLVRIRLQKEEHLTEIKKLQKEMNPVPLSNYGQNYVYLPGKKKDKEQEFPMTILSHLQTDEVFNIYNSLVGDNPGLAEDIKYAEKFLEYNIGAGKTFNLSDYSLKEQEQIKQIAREPRGGTPGAFKENNWEYMPLRYGRYYGDYKLRAYLSFTGFGQNFPELSVYPTTYFDSDNEQLCGKNKYLLHFSKDNLPPCADKIGYWAITAYYKKDYTLIPNELSRYSLGSASPLKYNSDGSLDIYIQQEKPQEKKISNWLPVDENDFMITLRLYYPGDSIMNKIYTPPYVKKI